MSDNKHLIPANIDIGLHHFSIDKIIYMLKCGDLILDKSFIKLRNDEWNSEKKTLLIESLIVQVPINNFYFEITQDGKYIVVDGWQRLNALNKFMSIEKDNPERFRLNGLKYLEKLEGFFWEELSLPIRRRISERYIDIYVVRSWVPEEVKNDLAIRMG